MNENLAGRKFGRWTVIFAFGRRRWCCACDCGVVRMVIVGDVKNGKSTNCGCVLRAKTSARNTTHGKAGTPEHRAWKHIKGRCHNPKHARYADYGGRGIFVCAKWRDDFPAFLRDMGERPSDQHTIDRTDNEKGYEPGNCRWATRQEQSLNKRSSVRLAMCGRVMPLSEWAKALGVDYTTLHHRYRQGWPVDRLLGDPVLPKPELIRWDGQELTLKGWADALGIPYTTLHARRRKGLTGAALFERARR